MSCTALSSVQVNARHNAIVRTIAHFARLLLLSPRIEPAELAPDSDTRPDIQLDLADRTILADVTVSHPLARSHLETVLTRGVEAVGDKRESEKNRTYTATAVANDMIFTAIVIYTFGGLHKSTMNFIKTLSDSVDPAICLLSRTSFTVQLLSHIAMDIQRGNARIMIADNIRGRSTAGGMGHPNSRVNTGGGGSGGGVRRRARDLERDRECRRMEEEELKAPWTGRIGTGRTETQEGRRRRALPTVADSKPGMGGVVQSAATSGLEVVEATVLRVRTTGERAGATGAGIVRPDDGTGAEDNIDWAPPQGGIGVGGGTHEDASVTVEGMMELEELQGRRYREAGEPCTYGTGPTGGSVGRSAVAVLVLSGGG
jgi:hypothetical protein